MDSNQNPIDSDFSWSDFEQLKDIEEFQQDLDTLAIPDATYRQLKELNQALILKASQLAQFQQALEQQQQELELARANFNATRIQSTRESTESRLQRLVKQDQTECSGPSQAQIDFVEIAEPQAVSAPELSIEELADESGEGLSEIKLVDEDAPSEDEVTRFQKSAQLLREKSEVISAVFVELDQMVRDLNRQQELLEELKVNQNAQSASELDRVNDKLRRRFKRLSKQISNP